MSVVNDIRPRYMKVTDKEQGKTQLNICIIINYILLIQFLANPLLRRGKGAVVTKLHKKKILAPGCTEEIAFIDKPTYCTLFSYD